MRVLLINGDVELARNIKHQMEKEYIVDVAHNGVDGTYLSQVNDYSAILIDTNLPDIESHEVCRITREADIRTPILMLLNDEGLAFKLCSLECGVDAFLNQPLNYLELAAYIRALNKRAHKLNFINRLIIGDLVINTRTKEVKRQGDALDLRRKEFDILELLAYNKNRVVTKDRIIDYAWEDGLCFSSNTVEVAIKNLRDKVDRKYEHKLIKTVHGFGYKLEEPPKD